MLETVVVVVGARENSKMSVPEVHRSYANTNFDLSIPTQLYSCIEACKGLLVETVDVRHNT